MANFMLSYYPKANFHNFIDGNIEADSILFIDKEKSRKLSNQAKVQFFGKLEGYDFNTIIRKAKAFVKGNSKISENSQKFSDRDPELTVQRDKVNEVLERENERLRKDRAVYISVGAKRIFFVKNKKN